MFPLNKESRHCDYETGKRSKTKFSQLQKKNKRTMLDTLIESIMYNKARIPGVGALPFMRY